MSPDPDRKERCLVFLGDSYVNGTGDPQCLGWAGRVCRLAWQRGLPVTYYNLGVRGAASADVLERWRVEAGPRLHADMDARLVAAFGLNDLWDTAGDTGPPVENLRVLLGEAAPRHPVLVVGPPPVAVGGDLGQRVVDELARAYSTTCERSRVPYVGVADELRRTGTWIQEATAGDGFHPGSGGYEELAAVVDRSSIWREWLGSLTP